MAEYSKERYYWLKLRKDFFKRHDVRILQAADNGPEIVLLYLHLMCESIDHAGRLRFNNDTPYSPQMLALLTSIDQAIVEQGLTMLQAFGLMVEEDDGTLYLPKVAEMIGSQTKGAAKKIEQRKRRESGQLVDASGTQGGRGVDKYPLDIDKETDTDKEKSVSAKPKPRSKKSTSFVPPTIQEVKAYVEEKGYSFDVKAFFNYYANDDGSWTKKNGERVTDWKKCCATWHGVHGQTSNKPKEAEYGDYGNLW